MAPTACSGIPGELILPCWVLGAALCRPRWLVVSGALDERNHPKMKFQEEKKKEKKTTKKERNAEQPGTDPECSVPALPWAHALY